MYCGNMNKTQLLEELEKMDTQLSNLISGLREKPEMKISGSLHCCSRGSKTEFSHILEDGRRVYIGNDSRELLVSLARKKHYGKMLEAAENEKHQISRCIAVLKSGRGISDVDEVYGSLHEGIRKLSGPLSITNDSYAIQWYRTNSKFRKQTQKLTGNLETMTGVKVSSKSEVIIADRLDAAGVPYIYEITLGLDGGDQIRYPDFMILNKRLRKTFLWEHLGMLDKGTYCTDAQVKLEAYARNGYFPGRNLLLTFESERMPLSTRYVDSLIKEFLL